MSKSPNIGLGSHVRVTSQFLWIIYCCFFCWMVDGEVRWSTPEMDFRITTLYNQCNELYQLMQHFFHQQNHAIFQPDYPCLPFLVHYHSWPMLAGNYNVWRTGGVAAGGRETLPFTPFYHDWKMELKTGERNTRSSDPNISTKGSPSKLTSGDCADATACLGT